MQRIDFNRWTSVASNHWLQNTKYTFYQIFRPSWLESFTPSNIQGAFEKAGIWPFSPPIVLDAIARRPVTPPDAQDDPAKPPPTPMTSKSIRRAQKNV